MLFFCNKFIEYNMIDSNPLIKMCLWYYVKWISFLDKISNFYAEKSGILMMDISLC